MTKLVHYIDGYNYIFQQGLDAGNLQASRETLLSLLKGSNECVIVVFDGDGVDGPERTHQGELEIVYTGKGQCADGYIVEELERKSQPRKYRIVTSDKRLAAICHAQGVSSISIEAFHRRLTKKKAGSGINEKPSVDSSQQIKRLQRIFEQN